MATQDLGHDPDFKAAVAHMEEAHERYALDRTDPQARQAMLDALDRCNEAKIAWRERRVSGQEHDGPQLGMSE